ncbi:MAG: GNAT family N-acetyltransferase, partial [Desulfuromonadales bacterium]|nr:GNAT family N-acetyltransferase [Desulfuromonadales bacterium]NIS40652.1 GNAT family N-acetyltransferase [Desulfuromonadales bacterium]
KQFRAELENPCSHIDLLISDDKIAGYICSWEIAGELEIQNIATGPDFRRRGFAEQLLQTVIDRAAAAAV